MRRHDELAGVEHRTLGAGEEVGDGHQPPTVRACDLDRRPERDQDRQRVAGRGRRREVAADRRGVADLRRADRTRGVRERGNEVGDRIALELRERRGRADHDRRAVDADSCERRHPSDGHDPRERSASVVDLDHEIGSAREDRRIGIRGQRRERGFE